MFLYNFGRANIQNFYIEEIVFVILLLFIVKYKIVALIYRKFQLNIEAKPYICRK